MGPGSVQVEQACLPLQGRCMPHAEYIHWQQHSIASVASSQLAGGRGPAGVPTLKCTLKCVLPLSGSHWSSSKFSPCCPCWAAEVCGDQCLGSQLSLAALWAVAEHRCSPTSMQLSVLTSPVLAAARAASITLGAEGRSGMIRHFLVLLSLSVSSCMHLTTACYTCSGPLLQLLMWLASCWCCHSCCCCCCTRQDGCGCSLCNSC